MEDSFELDPLVKPVNDQLVVDVQGFEGPLDLLLAMARTQKVDLTQIAILPLVEQYLDFISEVKRMRLEIAADYLVMAAWLTYLKSRLLVPETVVDEEEPTADELAAALAFRLQRLEAMRDASVKLFNLPRLGKDVFARGAPEGIRRPSKNVYTAELYDLLRAYAIQRQKNVKNNLSIKRRQVVTLEEAKEILERLIGKLSDWAPLHMVLSGFINSQSERRSAVASTFCASLEFARTGEIEIKQTGAFDPIYIRSKSTSTSPGDRL